MTSAPLKFTIFLPQPCTIVWELLVSLSSCHETDHGHYLAHISHLLLLYFFNFDRIPNSSWQMASKTYVEDRTCFSACLFAFIPRRYLASSFQVFRRNRAAFVARDVASFRIWMCLANLALRACSIPLFLSGNGDPDIKWLTGGVVLRTASFICVTANDCVLIKLLTECIPELKKGFVGWIIVNDWNSIACSNAVNWNSSVSGATMTVEDRVMTRSEGLPFNLALEQDQQTVH